MCKNQFGLFLDNLLPLIKVTGFLLNVLLSSLLAQWPTSGWPTATPSEMGLDSLLLIQARDYALNTGTGGGSGYITRGGKLVLSWGNPTKKYDIKSSTKSIGAIALGLAVKDSLIHLDSLVQKYHQDVGIPPDSNASTGWLEQIKILHLATHTSGFDIDGGYTGLLFQPGSAWRYSDGSANWLAEAITMTYMQSLDTLMFNRVFDDLGITSADLKWRNNAYRPDSINGIKNLEFGSGISITVDAMARIGYLMLREGQWDSLEIIPPEYIEILNKPIPSIAGLPMYNPPVYNEQNSPNHYGLLWWNNSDTSMFDIPPDTYMSWGKDESFIVVIPSLDIVISRAGKKWRANTSESFYGYLRDFLNSVILATTVNLSAKVFLEGSYDSSGDSMTTILSDRLPLSQPYNNSSWNYSGAENVASIPDSVVDWILVELRQTYDGEAVAMRAGFLRNNGSIVDTNGCNPLNFKIPYGDYYICLHHRNHLSVMSDSAHTLDANRLHFDFTTSQSSAYSNGQDALKDFGNGKFGMFSGDPNSNLFVNATDYLIVKGEIGSEGYYHEDCNLNGVVNATDYLFIKNNIGRNSQVP
jgi:CubicO group peptidase (beta-lactamase class C family)